MNIEKGLLQSNQSSEKPKKEDQVELQRIASEEFVSLDLEKKIKKQDAAELARVRASLGLEQMDEKKDLQLYQNLNLGENAAEAISKSEELIISKDVDGSKIKIFEEAMDYYSNPQEKIADVPILHSTGSYALAKILNHGSLESTKNIGVTGEKATTREKSNYTSFVIGGYPQSETVSYFYARKNEKESSLGLDRKDVTGKGPEDDFDIIFKELPNLQEKERAHISEKIKIMKGDRNISGRNLLNSKIKELGNREYYFNKDKVEKELKDKKDDLAKSKPENEWYDGLKKEVENFENRLNTYNNEDESLKQEMTNPFPVILTYEGKNLPQKDLTELTSVLVSERRTQESISNDLLKQIQVPQNKIEHVKKWINSLPDDKKESLKNIKIVPLEYFEAKKIIDDNKP